MQASKDEAGVELPTLEKLISKRDFLGAITLLQVTKTAANDPLSHEWLAYCYFHAGQYARALQVYETLSAAPEPNPLHKVYAAACQYYTGNYNEAQKLAAEAQQCPLATRIRMHCAHALGDEEQLVELHGNVSKTDLEDQLSLAAVHFRRSHFQEATDIYKRILLEN